MTRASALLVALLMFVTACGAEDKPVLAGTELEPNFDVGGQSLPAVNRGGEDFAFRADEGEMLLVYFAFTNCPDFCPTTLSDARFAYDELGERATDIDVAVVTIDPDRDTEEILTSYVEAFFPDGIALRTEDQDRLRETAFAFGADYRITENEEGETEVGHTTRLFAVDETGAMILSWPFGVTIDDYVNDFNILLDRIEAA